ncbi:DnaB-like helicase C-terminal domain-containing protein [Hyphomicrobium sp. ghe19]|uniref:DnaB-like helicase C-terminal domain-containing protein n=1 Tax=Hyphomicrobium sp. ghe19 TaxID=2682968 RepID=UPI00136700CE|nr:hypothetical protein HYPP_02613 [Hyphomicrobium sp. ghe19]
MTDSDSEFIEKGPCPKCGSSDANAIYDDGHTYCFSCGKPGRQEGFEDVAKKPTKNTIGKTATATKTTTKKAVGLLPAGEDQGWKARNLSEATCKKWGITLSEMSGNPVRVFAYKNRKNQTIAQKVRPPKKEDMRFLGDAKEAGLYGQHLWRDKGKKVVITEGEIDAASVSQVQNHKWPVVSVPTGSQGARKALQKSLDWLNGYDEVILYFDNDEPGQAAAVECASLFKPGQCKIAKTDLKDANEMLKAGRGSEIVDAIFGAKEYRPDGIVMGSELWGALQEDVVASPYSYPWTTMQSKTLGPQLGQVITLTAGSGIGKSSIVREMAHHFHSTGTTIGMMMFEETVRRTALGLISVAMSKNLTLVNNPAKLKGFKQAFDATMGSGRIALYDHFGSTSIDNVLDRIRYMAKSLDCKMIFVDHLSILISGMGEGDERRLIDNAMTALKTLAMECNICIFLVSHLKRPEGKAHENGAETSLGQLRGSAAIAQLSDIVLGVERNQQDEKLKNFTRLRILKNRYTGETGVCGWLKYDKESGRLTELLEDPFSDDYDFADETEGDDASPY